MPNAFLEILGARQAHPAYVGIFYTRYLRPHTLRCKPLFYMDTGQSKAEMEHILHSSAEAQAYRLSS